MNYLKFDENFLKTIEKQKNNYLFPYMYKNKNDTDANLYNRVVSESQIINNKLKKLSLAVLGDATLTAHVIRHSFCSSLIHNGYDLVLTQKIMEHSSLATTERYIKSLYNEEEENTKMNDFFDKKIWITENVL